MGFDSINLSAELIERSVVSLGNRARLARVMRKAQRGEKICVALIGGSITQGAYASDTDRTSYAAHVRDWWINAFPNAEIEFHNGGVGGTQSILGVHRVERDTLRYDPDFVIVEFAVNDHPAQWETEAYSNLCRRLLSHKTAPAVMLLFTMNSDGSNTQETEITVGEHYGLPMVSYRDAMRPELEAGRVKWEDIAKDWVHPNDRGHAIIGTLVGNMLQRTLDGIDAITDTETPLPCAFISDRYADAYILTYDDIAPEEWGSFSFKEEVERHWLTYKKYWHSEGGDDPIVFRLTGSRIFLLYDGGTTDKHKISVSIDGGEMRQIGQTTLDAGSAAIYTAFDGECGEHTVAVRCDEGVFDMKGILIS